MKSIMEEASTIFKAVEKAWIRAEKPQSFSVKILEEPTKNFIGMTTKAAKIALLFDEVPSKVVKGNQNQSIVGQAKKPTPILPQNDFQNKRERKPVQKQVIQQQAKKQFEQRPPAPQTHEQSSPEQQEKLPLWNENIKTMAQNWCKETLTLLGKTVPPFTTEVKNKHLIIAFETSIMNDPHQERLLFSSIAHLMLQAARNKFKSQARGLKVILKTNSK